jgi:hypothetical protein
VVKKAYVILNEIREGKGVGEPTCLPQIINIGFVRNWERVFTFPLQCLKCLNKSRKKFRQDDEEKIRHDEWLENERDHQNKTRIQSSRILGHRQ